MTCSALRLLALILCLAPLGCGGGLKYTVDEGALDQVSAADRHAITEAYRELETARVEKRAASKNADSIDPELVVAKREVEQAELALERAQAEEEVATASGDILRIATSNRAKELVSLQLKTAEARMDFLAQKEDWLEQLVDAATAREGACEARVEMEKARVAERKGIASEDEDEINLGKFEEQWRDKNDDWQDERKDAEAEGEAAKRLEASWSELDGKYKKLRSAATQ